MNKLQYFSLASRGHSASSTQPKVSPVYLPIFRLVNNNFVLLKLFITLTF